MFKACVRDTGRRGECVKYTQGHVFAIFLSLHPMWLDQLLVLVSSIVQRIILIFYLENDLEIWWKGCSFHQDNIPANKSMVAVTAIGECGFTLIDNPYSPDLAPSDITWKNAWLESTVSNQYQTLDRQFLINDPDHLYNNDTGPFSIFINFSVTVSIRKGWILKHD